MAAINVDQLVADIRAAATPILNKDLATVRGFSERQLMALAQQAALVSAGIASHQIMDDTREFFLHGLEQMTQSFLDTLQGLFMATLEKLWNAIVGVVWNTINGAIAATGIVLPVPTKI